MKIKPKLFFYFTSFFLLLLLTIKISPLSDDWYYSTSPNVAANLSQLLPGKAFWRPFDALFGFLLGLFPSLFPYLNRICVISAHIISVFFIQKILEHLNIKSWIIRFCVLYAMFSSSVLATVVSPDGLNQAFSLLFGLIGLYSYFKNPKSLLYVIFCIASVLWKESGIVWICVIPFLCITISLRSLKEIYADKTICRRIIKAITVALFFCIVYFSVRFLLAGSTHLGIENSRYSISFFSLSVVKNLINIFANALTGIDTIALFTGSPTNPLFILTALLSFAFLCFILYVIADVFRTKANPIALFATIISALVISLPHIVIGSAGEMHTYPTIFSLCLVYACLFNQAPNISKKGVVLCAVCIFASFLITGIHKFAVIYDYSNKTEILTQKMIENYTNPEDTLLIIHTDNKKGYSVFTQSAITGTDYASSMKPHFGWKSLNIKHIKALNAEEANVLIKENLSNYDKVWLVINDEIDFIK